MLGSLSMARRQTDLLLVQTGRQPASILTGTQPQGYPMCKPTLKKEKNSCKPPLLRVTFTKKGLPWRLVHTRTGAQKGYGPDGWDWTPSRCRITINILVVNHT